MYKPDKPFPRTWRLVGVSRGQHSQCQRDRGAQHHYNRGEQMFSAVCSDM